MMTRAIVAKILKDPIHNLKANGHSNHDYLEMVKELFQLNVESQGGQGHRCGLQEK